MTRRYVMWVKELKLTRETQMQDDEDESTKISAPVVTASDTSIPLDFVIIVGGEKNKQTIRAN